MTPVPGIDPVADEASREYWAAVAEGRLLVQRCRACSRAQFYPRGFCKRCFAPDPEWIASAGRGRIHTFSTVYRTSDARFTGLLPYTLAIVELDEGVRLTTRIVETELDEIRCDLDVEVVFDKVAGDLTLPLFRTVV